MNKNLHNIDDLFKNSIEAHAEEVPPDVWNNIDHNLDKKQAAFYKRRYFTVRAAAILLMLVGGVTIAAILRFHQSGKTLPADRQNQNTVSTSNERNNSRLVESSIQKETGENLNVEEKKKDEQNTVLDNNNSTEQENELSNNTVDHRKKNNAEKHGSISDDVYSAEKNDDVSIANNRKKSSKQDVIVKFKPAIKNPMDMMINKQNNSKKEVEEKNASLVETEIKDVQRTTYIDGSLLGINRIDLTTSLADGFNASPIILTGVSASPGKIRVRNRFNGWSIAPMYAQNVNLNTLKDDDHFFDPRNNSREVKRTEQETISFSTGIGIQRQISRNIFLQSGIQYFSSKTKIEPKTIFAEPDASGDVRFRFSCSSGESYLPSKTGVPPARGDSIKANFSQSEIAYLQVPLLVSYQINFGKFSLMPSAGIQSNFLLNGKLNSLLEHPAGAEEVSSSIDGLRPNYLSGVIQPELNYKLTDRISFDFNPNLSFSLSPINKETAVKTYQNMFGVGAGVRIKL